MSTAAPSSTTAPSEARTEPVPAPGPAPAEERGRLDIHPAVLRKIVEHAVDQVPGTLHRERTLAGFDVGDAGIKARITTGAGDPDAVDVRLEMALRYPGSVRDVVADVRAKVADELARVAGRHVRTLAVTVTGLRPSEQGSSAQGSSGSSNRDGDAGPRVQ